MANKMVLIYFEALTDFVETAASVHRFYILSCVLYVYTNFLLHLHSSKTSVSNDAPAAISAALRKLVSMSHWQD